MQRAFLIGKTDRYINKSNKYAALYFINGDGCLFYHKNPEIVRQVKPGSLVVCTEMKSHYGGSRWLVKAINGEKV